MQIDVFRSFCNYVDESIFSKENMGAYVAFVIDQTFIDNFCRMNYTTEEELMSSVRSHHWRCHYDHMDAKGFIAVQLFAASKRANSGGLTAKDYYGRLSQITGLTVDYLSKTWMPKNQDTIWSLLYNWCDKNYYKITKCERRDGPYCHVQYPLTLAKRVFTEEDLLYIAKIFVDKKLLPKEDITQTDFWKIINRHSLYRYFATHHAIDVVNNSMSEDDYMSQIYNYFLRWDGRYKFHEKIVHVNSTLNELYVYITEDLTTLELRDENLKLLHDYSTNLIKYTDIKSHIPFKREGVLLFKHDDIYENRWRETRYIEAENNDYSKESGMYAIVICFKNTSKYEYKLRYCDILFENNYLIICKITRSILTEDFFTQKRTYELYGGLKIGRCAYLKGATPILRLHKPSMAWIDGKAIGDKAVEGDYSLNYLEVGSHTIKLPNTKKITFDIVDASANLSEWQDDYNKWQIEKQPAIWQSEKRERGIVGLDFSCISETYEILETSTAKRWAYAVALEKYYNNENNIAINITR